MTLENLKFILQLSNVVIDQCKIETFDLVQGDFVYVTGETNECKNCIYKLLTFQTNGSGTKAEFGGQNLFEISNTEIYKIRRKVAFLEQTPDLKTNEEILVYLERLNMTNNHSLVELNDYFKIAQPEETNVVFSNLKLLLSTNPQILIIDHTFDSLTNEQINSVLDALLRFKNEHPLALIINTNNAYLTSKYLGRTYKVINKSIVELDV